MNATAFGYCLLLEMWVKRMDGTTVDDATLRLADDLKQFEGKVDADGRIYKLTGRKL